MTENIVNINIVNENIVINEPINKYKKLTIDKIKNIQEKITNLNSKIRPLYYKYISEYATKTLHEFIPDCKIKLKCATISDIHYSNGECKRTIRFFKNNQKITSNDNSQYFASYVYWYTDSTIYMHSETNSEGIQIDECCIKEVNEINVNNFFELIDDAINWNHFR